MSQDDAFENLFRGLAPRQGPSPAAREQAYLAANQAFQETFVQRRRRAMMAGMAATVLLSVAIGWQFLSVVSTVPIQVADARTLLVNQAPWEGGAAPLVAEPGLALATSGPARLLVGGTTDLRLAPGTRITWQEGPRLRLERGRIYVDTRDKGHLTVTTDLGTVTDVGTRFLVDRTGSVLNVAVRSGETRIDSDHGSYRIRGDGSMAEVVRVTAQGVERHSEPASDERWMWIHEVPTGYHEQRLSSLLPAIARDLGLDLVYADRGVQATVLNLNLGGDDLHGLPPRQALEVALAASGLGARTEDGSLVVYLQAGL